MSESKTGSAPQPGLAPSVSPQPGFREHRQVRRRCAGGPHGAAGRYVKTPGPRINPSAPSGVKSRTTPTCQALAARSPKTTIAILVLAVQAVGQPPVDDPVWNDDDHGHRPWDRASTLRSPLPQLRVSSGRTPRCGSVAVHDPDGGSRAERLRRIGITNLSFPTLRINQLMIVLELPIRRRRGREQKRRDTLRDQLIDHLTPACPRHSTSPSLINEPGLARDRHGDAADRGLSPGKK